jgi:hypothetical protein
MTTIEKSLARLAAQIDTIDRKLDALAQVSVAPSALTDGAVRDAAGLFASVASDNVAGAAARLRVLHDPQVSQAAARNPFGKPASTTIIDGEFTEVNPKEG